jgi:IS30 family transposase
MPDSELVATPQPIPDYGRLTNEDRYRIRLMAAAGLTQVQIAQEIGCSQSTVSDWLKASYNPVETATDKIREALPRLADRYIEEARPQDLIQTFRDFKVQTQQVPDQGRGGVHVSIGVAAGDVQVNFGSSE